MYEFTTPPDTVPTSAPAPGEKPDKNHPTFISASQVPSQQLRERMLTWPGERIIDVFDLPQARLEGYGPVALVFHGATGSRREPWPGQE